MTEQGESLGVQPELRRAAPGEGPDAYSRSSVDAARPAAPEPCAAGPDPSEHEAATPDAARDTPDVDAETNTAAAPATRDGHAADRDTRRGEADADAAEVADDSALATHDTVKIDLTQLAARETVKIDLAQLGARETVKIDVTRPVPREPLDDEIATMDTVLLPRGRPAGSLRPRGAPLPVAALVNTSWATLLVLGPLMLLTVAARAAEGAVDWGLSLRLVLAGWLLGHGVPVTVGVNGQLGTMELAPLALTAFALWRINRAGVHTTRAMGAQGSGSIRHAVLGTLAVALVYGCFGVLAAVLADGPGLFVTPWRAGLHLLALGAVGAAVGVLRSGGVLRRLARHTPVLLRDGIRAGVVAVLLVLAVGAGAVGLAVAMNGTRATHDLAGFSTGVLGQAGLVLLSLVYGPNFAVWAASYLLGPGFAAGTLPMTGLPVFAGVPTGPLQGLGWLLTVLPLLGGVAAAVLMARRRLRPRRTRLGDVLTPEPRWLRLSGSALTAGVVAGVLLAVAAYASGGALPVTGPVRTGPVVWQVAAMAALVVSLGGLLGVAGFWAVRGVRKETDGRPAVRTARQLVQ
ncbi:cell division protein PerM [Catellatospora methionotrophica]|uniref:cell division protein PerM n=1 Tax=Catellatospora methionotrophica TaxID=121620 RepID=UPI00340EB599